ncbi:MAG TPA: ATP synthase subunit I [Acidimicrobiales bacterium]|nr:ATP synthase subunit I [Acidimicrobiales bacterium]
MGQKSTEGLGQLTTTTEAIPEVEKMVVADMARRSLPVAPVLLLAGAVFWGLAGLLSSAYGFAIALANLALSAALLSWAARRGLSFLMATALGGYLLRLGLLTVAVQGVRHSSWVEMVPLGVTILITHLGLLWWETKHLSMSLAFPGLKPSPAPAAPGS